MPSKQLTEQLNFFKFPKNENDFLWEAITQLKESHNSVRKRLFKEIEELKNSIIETKAQNEKLKAIHSLQNESNII